VRLVTPVAVAPPALDVCEVGAPVGVKLVEEPIRAIVWWHGWIWGGGVKDKMMRVHLRLDEDSAHPPSSTCQPPPSHAKSFSLQLKSRPTDRHPQDAHVVGVEDAVDKADALPRHRQARGAQGHLAQERQVLGFAWFVLGGGRGGVWGAGSCTDCRDPNHQQPATQLQSKQMDP
jgi:hypothetical protein